MKTCLDCCVRFERPRKSARCAKCRHKKYGPAERKKRFKGTGWASDQEARKAAIKAGAPRYKTKNPCPSGHTDERFSSNGTCVTCNKEWRAKWGVENPGAAKEISVRKRTATPPWADMDAIRAIYKDCPHGFEVDHIIPLRGRNVSGLHVPSNLQHLPASVNRRKSNLVFGL